jgi:hypothetical protein
MKQKFTLLLWFIICAIHTTFAQTLETFESQTTSATTFTSNTVTFNLATNATSYFVASIAGLGYNGSNKFLHVTDNYGQICNMNVSSGTFTVTSLWLYITGNAAQDPGVTSNGNPASVIFRGKLGATTVFTVTKTSGFATTFTFPGNGFALVDFTTEGGVNNSTAQIDKLEIELSSNLDYFAVDNFTWQLGVVPVTLTSFAATKVQDAAVLAWSTASEINNDRFILERSADGTSFAPIGEVKGNGNSSKVIQYSYTDKDAVSWARLKQADVIYYRLKQADYDGKIHVYGVTTVSVGKASRPVVSVSPNPFINEFTVSLSGSSEANVDIAIIDITGKTVYTTQATVQRGNTSVRVHGLDDLRKGVYFVSVKSGGESFTQRIIKTF